MKKRFITFIFPLCLLFLTFACDDMNSLHQADLDRGETIYPGKVDSIEAVPGNGRVKLSWLINADSRIVKTVIRWNNGRDFVSVPLNRAQVEPVRVSTELSLPEGAYIFVFYTVDDDGNTSLETEKTVEVYGPAYGAILQSRNIVSMTPLPGLRLQVRFPEVLDGDLLYTVMRYTDNSQSPPRIKNVRIENSITDTVIAGAGLETFYIRSVFRPEGGLDTVSSLTRPYVPYVVESDILLANGIDISKYSAAAADTVRRLVYPLHVSSHSAYEIPDVTSFQDLYYFPNLRELDLTGTGFPVTSLVYNGNNISREVGGGDRLPFMRRTGDFSAADRQIIKDLLASGQLTKVRYIPNSAGLDADLAPYAGSGTVELADNFPDEVPIPYRFNYPCAVENTDLTVDIAFSENLSGIAGAPPGTGLENIYKVTMLAPNGSVGFALPAEYEFNLAEYRYLKFKVFAPAKERFENYDSYRRLWVRLHSGIIGETRYGNGAWDNGKENIRLTDGQLGKWEDITVDISAAGQRRRVIKLTVGAEGGGVFPVRPDDMVFYFANFRLAK